MILTKCGLAWPDQLSNKRAGEAGAADRRWSWPSCRPAFQRARQDPWLPPNSKAAAVVKLKSLHFKWVQVDPWPVYQDKRASNSVITLRKIGQDRQTNTEKAILHYNHFSYSNPSLAASRFNVCSMIEMAEY